MKLLRLFCRKGRPGPVTDASAAEPLLAAALAVLEAGGAGPEHLVRLTWYVTDRNEYNSRLKELGAVYREVLGKNFPAMACVQVAGLMEERAKIEIEATAVIPD